MDLVFFYFDVDIGRLKTKIKISGQTKNCTVKFKTKP